MCLNIKHRITGSHPSRQRKQYVMSLFQDSGFSLLSLFLEKKVMALLGLEKCWRTAATTSLLDLLAPFFRLLKCGATQKFLSFFFILFLCLPICPYLVSFGPFPLILFLAALFLHWAYIWNTGSVTFLHAHVGLKCFCLLSCYFWFHSCTLLFLTHLKIQHLCVWSAFICLFIVQKRKSDST